MALCLQLRQMEFLTIATMRSGRKKSCPLPCEKDLKKRGKRAHAYRRDVDSVSAYKCVLIILILDLLVPSRGEEKKEIEVSCPSTDAEYKTYMGGVDLILISLYCTKS